MTAQEGRQTMVRGKLSGLMIGALVLVAVGARGYAAETTVKASAPIKGEGRFYKIGDNQLLFMGYFQGNVEVEGQRGDLHGAGMVCPGLMEVDRTTRTQQGGSIEASGRTEEPPAQQVERGAPKHRPLQHFQPVDLALHRAV
jgi:hypothetical protein